MSSSNETIIEWFSEFIDKYRDEYSKLDRLDADAPNHRDFTSPCQVYIFRVIKFAYEQQLIIIWHQNTRPDKQIVVYGPFQDNDLLKELDIIAETEPWNELTNSTDSDNKYLAYADMLSMWIRPIHTNFDNQTNKEMRVYRGFGVRGSIIAERVWSELYVGNIANENILNVVQDVIKDVKQSVEPTIPHQQRETPEELLLARGAYFYPSIFIGKKPKPTFSQKNFNGQFIKIEQVIKMNFCGRELTINNKGLIAIICPKNEAIKIFNTIFGVYSLLKDKFFFAIRENELLDIQVDKKTSIQMSTSWKITTPRNKENLSMLTPATDLSRLEVSVNEIKEVLKKSEIVLKNETLSDLVCFLLESVTDYTNSQYSQAFIMAWYVLEKEMFEQWRSLIKDKKIIGGRREKLHSTNNWTIYHAVETLNLIGKISDEKFKQIDKLRIKRNNLVHRGKSIDKETCEELIRVISQLIKDKLEELIFSISNSNCS
ncbi:MAG: hypothetical protein ACP5NV_00710 [Candidatus Woesearchaeota archaeon]